jgi:hypothetical protein
VCETSIRRLEIWIFEFVSLTLLAVSMSVTMNPVAPNIAPSYNFREMKQIGPGFWNIQQPLMMGYVLDIRTHMNIVRLSSGRFLILDTVQVSPALKAEIDQLTDNGKLIEAVVATHPFHTLFFPAFHAMYPHVAYYGTPRHIKRQKGINWAGDISQEENLNRWAPDVEMSLPAGAEFVNPTEGNHFAGVFVFHRASKTVHIDDTIMYVERASCLLSCACVRTGSMSFHLSFTKDGLNETASAPNEFKAWLQEKVLDAWDFDNICTAHMGNMIGGAKAKLQYTLQCAEPDIQRISHRNSRLSMRSNGSR